MAILPSNHVVYLIRQMAAPPSRQVDLQVRRNDGQTTDPASDRLVLPDLGNVAQMSMARYPDSAGAG
ncbi:MAG: hypothetical protein ABSA16_09770 [Thermoguttaceae bacterium]